MATSVDLLPQRIISCCPSGLQHVICYLSLSCCCELLFSIFTITLDNKPHSMSGRPRARARCFHPMSGQAASVPPGKSGGHGHSPSSAARARLSLFSGNGHASQPQHAEEQQVTEAVFK